MAAASNKAIAVLPQGFYFAWLAQRHLLQAAYNLDHNEFFLEKGKDYGRLGAPPTLQNASRIDPGFTSWQSNAILKDNGLRHDYSFLEFFSVLGGADISLVQPPFMILPQEDVGLFGGCIEDPAGVRTEEVDVRNVPFDYAVPVLSGWDLAYECHDHHVREVGIWLEDIRYEKSPAETSGTLHYKMSSVLRDDGSYPGHLTRHKVNILGFKGRKPADLVPTSNVPGFCSRDSQGRLLLAVANIGEGDAPASTTSIQFSSSSGSQRVEIATPPIPRSFVANLDPIQMPAVCFRGDCSLTITVDFGNVVVETNEGNNVASGQCPG